MTRVKLDLFDASKGFNRGRPLWVEAAWYFIKCVFFLSPIPWPSSWKSALLRLFGAKIGRNCVIKPRVNIHLPWRLSLGDHCWVGEEAYLLNLAEIEIGAHSCISQRAFLCTGNHDYRDPSMQYRNQSIVIGEGAWVGAGAFIGPGVIVGDEAVICAGAVLQKSVQGGRVYKGNPAVEAGKRWVD